MRISCGNCTTEFSLDKDNTTVRVFTESPWASWVAATCTRCNRTNGMFVGWNHEEILDELVACARETRQIAPRAVMRDFDRAFATELADYYYRVPHHWDQRHLAFWKYQLSQVIGAEDFLTH